MHEIQQNYQFESASQALSWYADVIRQRNSARISCIYDKGILLEKTITASSHASLLPSDIESTTLLLTRLDKIKNMLCEKDQLLLTLKYNGDWHDAKNIKAMYVLQERLRQQGKRLRLNTRYSVRQIAEKIGQNYRTVHRNIDKAEFEFEKLLADHMLLVTERIAA